MKNIKPILKRLDEVEDAIYSTRYRRGLKVASHAERLWRIERGLMYCTDDERMARINELLELARKRRAAGIVMR
jgi:hypothetical protein